MKNISKAILSTAGCILLIAPISNFTKASAEVRYNDLDGLFQSTLNEILGYENTGETKIVAEKELIYDVQMNELGISYSFEYGENEGFAILIDDGELKVTEITTDGKSPYGKGEKSVYVSEGMYWYKEGEQVYDCITDLPVSEEAIETVSEFAYQGSSELQYASEQVSFLSRTETPYNVLPSIPLYIYGHKGGCVPIAGSNIIGYFDRTYPNLIPDYEPGRMIFGRYIFSGENEATMAVSEALHTDMGTTANGNTVSEFRSGMTKYVNRQGYSISFSSLMSWGKIKFDTAKTVVQQNKAIALFLKGYRCVTIKTEEGYDVLDYEYSTANHAVAGFGCLEVTYTFSNNTTRTDKYIHASMGIGINLNGYINVGTANIHEALAITIS